MAEQQRQIARSRELAASALTQLADDPELSVLLSLEAVRVSDTPQSQDVLRQALRESHVQATIRAHDGSLSCVSFADDGRLLLTGDSFGVVQLIATEGWQAITEFPDVGGVVLEARVTPDGDFVLVVVQRPAEPRRGTLQRWSRHSKQRVYSTEVGGELHDVIFSGDSRLVVAVDMEAEVAVLLDAETGQALKTLDQIKCAAVSNDGQWLIFGGGRASPLEDADAAIPESLWILHKTEQSWNELPSPPGIPGRTFPGDSDTVKAVAIDSTGSRFAAVSEDSTVRIYELPRMRLAEELEGAGRAAYALFKPSATPPSQLAILSYNQCFIWDLSYEDVMTQVATVVRPMGSDVHSMHYSPRGQWLVTASDDGKLHLWNADSHEFVKEFRGHHGAINDVAFSPEPDEAFVATAGADGTVRIWRAAKDPVEGQLETMPEHETVDLARRRVTRPLTPNERTRFLHE